ncbi:hypothetical protein [uncultured Tessaracoccus sp.]|uniref:hypothetical protein n=1 Tax=uncultured Tessaracoccus sp. TaxID=905023 RepID=UPI00261CA2A9|nr:hypothetical protein [uncultured Tessaracoccus sp.]
MSLNLNKKSAFFSRGLVLARLATALVIGTALLLTSVTTTSADTTGASAAATGQLVNHGEQIRKVQVGASEFFRDQDGTPHALYVVSGNSTVTAEVGVMNLETEQLVFHTRVPAGSSAIGSAFNPVDGKVYFGMSDSGHLYSYDTAHQSLQHLITVPAGQRVWNLTVADDGTVWFGVYPTANLYSFDPKTGELENHGSPNPSEQYLGAVAVSGRNVYVGSQPNGKMAVFDRDSRSYRAISMPDGFAVQPMRNIDLRGNLLFASGNNQIAVLDLSSGLWVDVIENTNPTVSPVNPSDDSLIYLRANGSIHSYNLSTLELKPIHWGPNAGPQTWSWGSINGELMLLFTYWNQGRTYGMNLDTMKGIYIVPDFEGSGAPLISLGRDNVGNIYSGGFLSPPGIAKFDTRTGKSTLLPGIIQVEGFGLFGNDLVFGRYPSGGLYRYDPSEPWRLGVNPQDQLLLGHEQNRPQDFLQWNEDMMLVTSVPDPGRHGGAISRWYPETGSVDVFRDVVKNQTPVSLSRLDDKIIVGSSIHGGYGVNPVTDSASIAMWDPETGQTAWTDRPFERATSISGLTFSRDRHLWGVLDSRTVFEYDVESRRVLRTITIGDNAAPRYGERDELIFDGEKLYGVTAGTFFVISPESGALDIIARSGKDAEFSSIETLTQDTHGDFYMVVNSTELASYRKPEVSSHNH